MPNVIVIDADKSFLGDIALGISKTDTSINLAGCFDSIASATKYLEANHADIVITDIFAPSQDCENFIEFCKTRHPATRLILTSATKDFAYARMAVKSANVVDFVTKPLDFEYLASSIRRLSVPLAEVASEPTAERTFCKKTEFFSDIVHGHITSIADAKQTLGQIGLSEDIIPLPCTLVHLHIDDFVTYIRTNWAQNSEFFYDAIRSAVPFETSERYCSMTGCSYGNLSWLIVHKKKNSTPDDLRDAILDIINRLDDKLQLPIYESSHKDWFSLSDMILSAEAENLSDEKPMASAITKALAYMRENYHRDISLAMVAEHVSISPMYFSSYFKKHTGEGFVSKLTNIRIEQVAKLLVTTDMTIRDIKIAVGYEHTGNFYKHFHDRYGMTPNEYKKCYFGR